MCYEIIFYYRSQSENYVLSLAKLHDWKLSDRAGARRTAAGFQISNTKGQAVT